MFRIKTFDGDFSVGFDFFIPFVTQFGSFYIHLLLYIVVSMIFVVIML